MKRREIDSLEFKIVGKYAYEVFPDEFPIEGIHFDMGDKQANDEFIKQFENGELESYYVVKYEQCNACKEWHQIDSCGQIYATSPTEAIAVGVETFGEIL